MPHPILEREFHFTAADLRANRQGYLSPAQDAALRQHYQDYLRGSVRRNLMRAAWLINLGAVAYLLAKILVPDALFWQFRSVLFSGTFMIYVSFALLSLGVRDFTIRPLELGQRRLRMVEGIPQLIQEWGWGLPGGYRVRYVLQIEGWRFHLQHYESYELLRHSPCCRVYFVKFAPEHIVLSIEVLGMSAAQDAALEGESGSNSFLPREESLTYGARDSG